MRISMGERLSVERHAYLYGREIVSGATCVSLRERDCQWSDMRISTGERLTVERHACPYKEIREFCRIATEDEVCPIYINKTATYHSKNLAPLTYKKSRYAPQTHHVSIL